MSSISNTSSLKSNDETDAIQAEKKGPSGEKSGESQPRVDEKSPSRVNVGSRDDPTAVDPEVQVEPTRTISAKCLKIHEIPESMSDDYWKLTLPESKLHRGKYDPRIDFSRDKT